MARNLNSLILGQVDPDGDETIGRRFVNAPNRIDFVNRTDLAFGYLTSGGSDIVLRIQYDPDDNVSVGAAQAFNIPVEQSCVLHSSSSRPELSAGAARRRPGHPSVSG